MPVKNNKHYYLVFVAVWLILTAFSYFLAYPKVTKSQVPPFTTVSARLTNSRLSFRGGNDGTPASGTDLITINGTADADDEADDDNLHLFKGDSVCFTPSTLIGCKDNRSYTVTSTVDDATDDKFYITPVLVNALAESDIIIATQSGQIRLAFTTPSDIPSGGDLYITVPGAASGSIVDGFPDYGADSSASGFDRGTMGTTDVAVTGCTDVNWTVASVTTVGGDHVIEINRATSTCTSGTAMTVTIGHASDQAKQMVNPAPVTSHSRGTADIYTVNIRARDAGNTVIAESDAKVGAIESVLVTARVDESMSFTVAGITADAGVYCGVTRTASTPDATAYAIPWGTVSSTYVDATHNAHQQLTVSTNSPYGYKVYIEENDQLMLSGNGAQTSCPGVAPDSGHFTFSGTNYCIRDTVCGGTACTHQVAYNWSDRTTYPGVGYSLQDQTGTSSKFNWNSTTTPCDKVGSGSTFCTKQMADMQGTEDPFASNAEIMTNAAAANGDSVYVCYRIALPGTQPAGLYYNKIQYTAVPNF